MSDNDNPQAQRPPVRRRRRHSRRERRAFAHRGPQRPDPVAGSLRDPEDAGFNRERVPERVVHAKGSVLQLVRGDGGRHAVDQGCLPQPGRQAHAGPRPFSTVAGEQGYADTDRTRAASP